MESRKDITERLSILGSRESSGAVHLKLAVANDEIRSLFFRV